MRIRALAPAAATLLLLTACTVTPQAPAQKVLGAPAKQQAAPTPFGETFTWSDGLAVVVSAPSPVPLPARTHTTKEWAAYQAHTVSVTNGSDTPFDPSVIVIEGVDSAGSLEQIFDAESGWSGAPSQRVAPDQTAEFTVAFGANDPASAVVTVSAAVHRDVARFSSGQ